MKIRCDILNYFDRENAYDRPRIIVSDAGFDQEMVEITINGETAKVVGKEMIEAIQRCLYANKIF